MMIKDERLAATENKREKSVLHYDEAVHKDVSLKLSLHHNVLARVSCFPFIFIMKMESYVRLCIFFFI